MLRSRSGRRRPHQRRHPRWTGLRHGRQGPDTERGVRRQRPRQPPATWRTPGRRRRSGSGSSGRRAAVERRPEVGLPPTQVPGRGTARRRPIGRRSVAGVPVRPANAATRARTSAAAWRAAVRHPGARRTCRPPSQAACHPRPRRRAGDPEVRRLRAVGGMDVRRLDVAVDHARRMKAQAVGGRTRSGQLVGVEPRPPARRRRATADTAP
jgi:hypothetical protein